jgi:hypothetical protein
MVLFLGVSFLVGCENTTTSGPPSPDSASNIAIPKAEPGAQGGKKGGRPSANKKPASGAAPSVPD